MAFSAFDDKTEEPAKEQLVDVLGGSAQLWDGLVDGIGALFDPLASDWTYSGKKWGWALRLKHKKRAVCYLTPQAGAFVVGFALGQKAVDAAHASDLPASVLEIIDGSQKYAEGRGVRMEVQSEADVRSAVALAAIKMTN